VLTDAIGYIKNIILEQDGNSESNYWLSAKQHGKSTHYLILWCLEPGKWIFLEKQFHFRYKFLNVNNDHFVQNWCKCNWNESFDCASISFVRNLIRYYNNSKIKHKFETNEIFIKRLKMVCAPLIYEHELNKSDLLKLKNDNSITRRFHALDSMIMNFDMFPN
jgi:hypothetical protein